MPRRSLPYWLAVVVALALLGEPLGRAMAQNPAPSSSRAERDSLYTLALRGVSLPGALERFVALTQSAMAYDADLVRGKTTFCTRTNAPAPELLQCILQDTGLDYVRSSNGTFILIASAREEPRYGQIAGVVVDEETGEPLPAANVLLADARAGTSTNPSGLFRLSDLVEGPHEVMISYVGYEMKVIRVEVTPGERTKRRIELTPRPILSEPVIIDGLQPRLPSSSLGHDEARAAALEEPAAGTGTGDVARTAGTLMGVATQSPLADLHIQGGASGEHEMVLDGAPVRNPVSVGRLISAFSPLALGRLTTHKAGYGAMQGSYLSGVVHLEHDLSRQDTRWVSVSADPVSTNARAQGRVEIYDRPVTVMSTARIGMWDVYRDPALNEMIQNWSSLDPLLARAWTTPSSVLAPASWNAYMSEAQTTPQPTAQFSDWHMAARAEITPYRYLYVSGYHGRSTIGASLLMDPSAEGRDDASDAETDQPSIPSYDEYQWNNTVGQARLEWLMGDRTIGSVQGYGSHYDARSRYRIGIMQRSESPGTGLNAPSSSLSSSSTLWRPDDRNRIAEFGANARLDIGLAADRRLELEAGVEVLRSQFRVSNAFIPTLRHDLTATRTTFAANAEWGLGTQTIVEAGTRLTYVASRQTVYTEPRLAVRYDAPDTALGGYSLRLAGGLYRQFTSQFDISRDGASAVVPTASVWLPTDHSLAPPRAYHLSLESLWTPAPGWTVNLETYAKFQPHLLAIDYPALRSGIRTYGDGTPDQSRFISSSRGQALGGGIRVAYAGDRLDASVSYNVSHAERTFPNRFNNRRVPTPWNEPHRLDAAADLQLGAGFSLQTNWTGIWGRAWGYRKAYYDYLTSTGPRVSGTVGSNNVFQALSKSSAPAFNNPADDRLPPLLTVDAGIGYDRTVGDVEIGALLQVANVLNRENVIDRSLVPLVFGYEERPRTLPGRLPTLSVRVSY